MPDLTPETLAELQRLLDAATARPWMVDDEGDDVAVIVDEGDEFSFIQIAADLHQGDNGLTDARLIAAAVNDLPALLGAAAELERMREGRDNSPRDEDGWATPGQMWAMLLDSPLNERMALLRAALRAMDAEHRCAVGFHHEAVQQRDELAAFAQGLQVATDSLRAERDALAAAVERVRALVDWHETKADKARRFRIEINGQNPVMDKAAAVHADASRRLRAALDGGES